MVVLIIREGLFNNRDGGGTGATMTFGAVGLFVARGSLHAEWALVPLAMNPNVSEDMAFKAGFVVTRVVLGQWGCGKSFLPRQTQRHGQENMGPPQNFFQHQLH